MRKERRSESAWKLRVYFDALKQVESLNDREWLEIWASNASKEDVFIPRSIYLNLLKSWALKEASDLIEKEAA